ncbi:hypothetical protein ZOSMA_22G01320 [Zostera marina]|uniref:FLZ-type domain-containing protein n=1 Tax=Zostera marina TaxID=29655 RepID=A0A0K9PKR8_ZOSMR|nr:hypothetical protein ZOSMA_22G01320 [Zostera marina]
MAGPETTHRHFTIEHTQMSDKTSASCLSVNLPSTIYRTRTRTFLDSCYLCRKILSHGTDIYIYRGDRAFCTEECRNKHIVVDVDIDVD